MYGPDISVKKVVTLDNIIIKSFTKLFAVVVGDTSLQSINFISNT